MDLALSPDSLSAIVAIIALGYLAIQVYSAVYSKSRKDFSQLLLESVVCGIIIVSIYNGTLRLAGLESDNTLSILYYLPLLLIALLLGLGTEANSADQKLTFNNVAWFNKSKRKDQWESHPGSLIISAGEILYMETDKPVIK